MLDAPTVNTVRPIIILIYTLMCIVIPFGSFGGSAVAYNPKGFTFSEDFLQSGVLTTLWPPILHTAVEDLRICCRPARSRGPKGPFMRFYEYEFHPTVIIERSISITFGMAEIKSKEFLILSNDQKMRAMNKEEYHEGSTDDRGVYRSRETIYYSHNTKDVSETIFYDEGGIRVQMGLPRRDISTRDKYVAIKVQFIEDAMVEGRPIRRVNIATCDTSRNGVTPPEGNWPAYSIITANQTKAKEGPSR